MSMHPKPSYTVELLPGVGAPEPPDEMTYGYQWHEEAERIMRALMQDMSMKEVGHVIMASTPTTQGHAFLQAVAQADKFLTGYNPVPYFDPMEILAVIDNQQRIRKILGEGLPIIDGNYVIRGALDFSEIAPLDAPKKKFFNPEVFRHGKRKWPIKRKLGKHKR